MPTVTVYPTGSQLTVDQIRSAARQGLIDEMRQSAVPLTIFCVAAGAVGGALFKGKLGLSVAFALAGYGAYRMSSGLPAIPQA